MPCSNVDVQADVDSVVASSNSVSQRQSNESYKYVRGLREASAVLDLHFHTAKSISDGNCLQSSGEVAATR
jgi:hypothetical protein